MSVMCNERELYLCNERELYLGNERISCDCVMRGLAVYQYLLPSLPQAPRAAPREMRGERRMRGEDGEILPNWPPPCCV